MKKAIGLLLFISSVFYVSTVSALILSFEPSDNNVFVGQGFEVDIVVSGLWDTTPHEIVSSFDLDVSYDKSILAVTSVVFGNQLGGKITDDLVKFVDPSSDYDALYGVFYEAWGIDIFESSVLPNDELAALQGDSVVLATLYFETLKEGVSPLIFDATAYPYNLVTGLDPLNPLNFQTVGEGMITAATRVPEPATLLLMLAGLLGLVQRKRVITV